MNQSHRKALADKYRPVLLAVLLLWSFCGFSQFNPSIHVTINDALGQAQSAPIEGRGMFWDATNFKWRDFQSTSEVLSYLPTSANRFSHFPIYIHLGGTLSGGVWTGGITQVWFFKDGLANANLVRWYTDSTSGCSNCLLIANNLSDLANAGTARSNIGLGNVDNTSDATKNAAVVTLMNKTISGLNNTFSNIPISALSANSTGLTITSNPAADISVTASPAMLGTSLGFNIPTGSATQRGAISSTDWIKFNNKEDSIHISNDSVYRCVNGTCTFQTTIAAGGGSGTVTNFTSGNLSGFLNTNVGTPTTTPNQTFTFVNACANCVFGNNSGSSASPAYFLPTSSVLNGWFGGAIQGALTLTTTGSSGAATLIGNTLNVPQYSTGSGGNPNANIGSGFRWAIPFTNNIKTVFGSLIIIDSTTNTNALTFTSDTTTGTGKLATQGFVSRTFQPIGNYITATTGDVVATGPGIVAATIQANAVTTSKINANAVTLAKMATNTVNSFLGYDGSGNPADVTFTTSGTSGPATLTGNVLNIPQYQGALTLTTTGSTGPATLISNTLNIPQYSGGGGSQNLSHNVRGDTLTITGGAGTADHDDPNNTPWYQRNALMNYSAWTSNLIDTTAVPADTVQSGILIWMHSFGEHVDLWDQHLITAMVSKYHLPFAGPGYIGGQVTNYGMGGYQTNGYILRSAGTIPKGRGLDDYSWFDNTLNDTLSINISPSTQGYLTFNDLDIFTFNASGGGTITVFVDGTSKGTINTSTGTGFKTTPFHNLGNFTHHIVLKTTSAGSAGVECLGMNAYNAATKGMFVHKASAGSTKISDFVAVPAALQIQELQAFNSHAPIRAVIMDWTINSIIAGVDTITVKTQLDTMVQRVKVALPNADIILIGPTDYSTTRYAAPISPIAAYTRQIKRLALDDTVHFFDLYKIVGPFQYAILNGTINASDSLHPTPQALNTGVGEFLNPIGSITSDTPALAGTFYQINGTLENRSLLGNYRYTNFKDVGGFFMDSITSLQMRHPSGNSFKIDLAASSTETVFTGAVSDYNFDNTILTSGLFNSTGAGTNLMTGKLAIGGGGITSGADFEMHKVTGTTNIFRNRLDDPTGIAALQGDNDAGLGYQISVTGTGSSFGGLFQPGTFQVVGEQGDTYLANATNNSLIFATNSTIRGKFDGSGNFFVGTFATGISTDSVLVEHSGQVKMVAQSSIGGGGTNIYNADGTLTGNRALDGSSSHFSLSLGNGLGNFINGFNVNAVNGINLNVPTGFVSITGGYKSNQIVETDANFSLATTNGMFFTLPAITANRTITLPSPSSSTANEVVEFQNFNTAAFSWSFSGTITDLAGNTFTTIPNGAKVRIIGTTTNWFVLDETFPTAAVESSAGTLTIAGASDYIYTGASATTWTLPLLAANQGKRFYIKNAGIGTITLNASGSDHIFDTTNGTSTTIATTIARILVAGPSSWYVE